MPKAVSKAGRRPSRPTALSSARARAHETTIAHCARAHFESLGRPRAVNRERMAEECGLVGLAWWHSIAFPLSETRSPLHSPHVAPSFGTKVATR